MGRNLFSKSALVILVVALFSIMALPGCKKIVAQVFSGFDLPLTNIPTVIPQIPVSYYTYSVARTLPFDLDSIVKTESGGTFRAKDLTSVSVKRVTLRFQNADSTTNLANFNSISISLYSNTNTTPVTVVTADVPDVADSTLNFDVSNSPEILPYLQGSTITYIFTAITRRPTLHSIVSYTDLTLAIR